MHERFVTLILGFQVQPVDDEFAQLAFGCLCVRSIGRGLARHVFCFFFLLFLNEDLDHLLDAIVCLASATPRSWRWFCVALFKCLLHDTLVLIAILFAGHERCRICNFLGQTSFVSLSTLIFLVCCFFSFGDIVGWSHLTPKLATWLACFDLVKILCRYVFALGVQNVRWHVWRVWV